MKLRKYISILFLLFTYSMAIGQVRSEAQPDSKELKNKVFIITELDQTNFLISDSIVVKYKLFVSQNMGIENWQEADKPVYKDFAVSHLKLDNIKITNEKYNGEKYRTVIFKEVILRPNKKGNLVIPEYALNLEISIPSKTEKNTYGQFILEEKKITIKTNKISLTVK